jgi:hypothetical protein
MIFRGGIFSNGLKVLIKPSRGASRSFSLYINRRSKKKKRKTKQIERENIEERERRKKSFELSF